MSRGPIPPPTRSDTPSSGTRQITLVVNANASGIDGRAGAERIARALSDEAPGTDVELVRTRSAEDLSEVWHPAPGRRIVLAGGDGTLHDAVNLPGTPPELALIPAGRANNTARSLGIPVDLAGAVRLAVAGEARPLDLIEARAGEHRVVGVEGVSVGFLALARARYHAPNSADVRAALAAGLGALVHFHPLDVRIRDHGTTSFLHVGQLFAANMPRFGTGLRVAPGADPGDGLLDVVALDVPGRRAIPGMLLRLRRGRHHGHHLVRSWRTDRMTIWTRGRSPVMVDTHDLGPGPVELRAMAGALALVRA